MKLFINFSMKKKILISVACVAAIALFFVCQKQTSLNSIITSNIAALTDNDNGYPVTIETAVVYKASSSLNAPIDWDDNPIQGTPWSYTAHNLLDQIVAYYMGGYSGEKYWCDVAYTNMPTTIRCYQIVVNNH